MATPFQRVDSAPRPSEGPVEIESRDVAEAALAAFMLDTYGTRRVGEAGPSELANDIIIHWPGFQNWLGAGFPVKDLASAAWKLAQESTFEADVEEYTHSDGTMGGHYSV